MDRRTHIAELAFANVLFVGFLAMITILALNTVARYFCAMNQLLIFRCTYMRMDERSTQPGPSNRRSVEIYVAVELDRQHLQPEHQLR
jgi:hypothetical protein